MRRREHLERRFAPNEYLGVLGELDAALDHRPDRREPERAYREPDLERPRIPRELLAVIGEVDLLVTRHDVLQVLGENMKRGLERRGLARQETPTLERHIQPLVRIEHHRVRALDAPQQFGPAPSERGEGAIRRIDMEP